MKILISRGKPGPKQTVNPVSAQRRHQKGMAVIVVLVLVSILLIYLAFNLGTLARLRRELQLLERQQTRRLQVGATSASTSTNQLPGAARP
jgi:hypothetical protein